MPKQPATQIFIAILVLFFTVFAWMSSTFATKAEMCAADTQLQSNFTTLNTKIDKLLGYFAIKGIEDKKKFTNGDL